MTGKATMAEEVAISGNVAGFHIRNGREIIVDPAAGADFDLLRSMLLGRIVSFLMRQRGWLPLHASGVVVDEQAVLFLGPCGAGKSTTAAMLHKRGHLVIADDLGAVRVVDEVCRVQPAWPCLRLRSDTTSLLDGLQLPVEPNVGKYRFRLGSGRTRAFFPVKRIYVLQYGDKLSAEIVPRSAAVVSLDGSSFIKRRKMEKEVMANHLRQCAAVSAAMPVRRLIRPQSLEALPEMVRFIEKDIAADA
ncbi:MAG TPA: hypothetical protein VGL72_18215 [Bryobacteraceae bacterium]